MAGQLGFPQSTKQMSPVIHPSHKSTFPWLLPLVTGDGDTGQQSGGRDLMEKQRSAAPKVAARCQRTGEAFHPNLVPEIHNS